MKIKFFLLLFIILPRLGWCESFVKFLPQVEVVEIGVPTPFKIQIWPVSNQQEARNKLLTFLNNEKVEFFSLGELSRFKRSANNYDLFETSGYIAFFKKSEKEKIYLYENQMKEDVTFILSNINFDDQKSNENWTLWNIDKSDLSFYIVLFSLIVLITIAFIFIFISRKNKSMEKKKLSLSDVAKELSQKDQRKELENFSRYLKKLKRESDDETKSLLSNKELENFLNYLEEIQYKKEWSELEKKKLYELKNKLKNYFYGI